MRYAINIILGLSLWICSNDCLADKTVNFIVEATIVNSSSVTEELYLQRGIVLNRKEVAIDTNQFQSLVLCDVRNADQPFDEKGEGWVFLIPPGETLRVELVCYCLNKGFAPPQIGDSLVLPGFQINSRVAIVGCENQSAMHAAVKEESKLKLPNVTGTGESDKTGEDGCKEAIDLAVRSICMRYLEWEDEIFNVKYIKRGSCTLEYEDKITFGLTKDRFKDIILINLKVGRASSDIRKQTFDLTCDLIPGDSKSAKSLVRKFVH